MPIIPAKAGLRRQDAEANIRAANGPKGMRQESHVIQCLCLPISKASTPPVEERVTSFFTRVKKEVTKKESTLRGAPGFTHEVRKGRAGPDYVCIDAGCGYQFVGCVERSKTHVVFAETTMGFVLFARTLAL